MSNISPEKIKSLRDKTGAGMMDCKNALVENNGEVENAIDWLRKKGIAKASKKASRVAAEGLVGLSSKDKFACLIEVNSETDFVSKNSDFQNFIEDLLKLAINKEYTIDEFFLSQYDSEHTVKDALNNIISKIGENIVIRRLSYLKYNETKSSFGFYIHNKVSDNIGKIACVVMASYSNYNESIADILKKIAMHISASKPLSVNKENIDIELINKEKSIYIEQLAESGKPSEIVDKIVEGKVKKFISEITLLDQNWILDPSKSVAKVISEFNDNLKCNLEILDYKLFVLGEGIETENKDFKEEVASQISDNK